MGQIFKDGLAAGDQVQLKNSNLMPSKITIEFEEGSMITMTLGVGQTIDYTVGKHVAKITYDHAELEHELMSVVNSHSK